MQQESLTAAFQEEERKAKTEDGKRKMVGDLLTSWYRDDACKIDVFITWESQKNPSWMKLIFPNIWEKFQFESKLKKHQEEQTALGNKPSAPPG